MDGIADIIVSAPGTSAGQSYVIFGNRSGFESVVELGDLLPENGGDGSQGFIINRISPSDRAGSSISEAGDINGDGIDDIITKADLASPDGRTRAGQSYVVFGKQTEFSPILNLSDLLPENGGDGSQGFVVNGINPFDSDSLGQSVSDAGDINGEGMDDFIVSSFVANPNGKSGAGQSYVIFGNAPSVLDLNGHQAGLDYEITFVGTPVSIVDSDELMLSARNPSTISGVTFSTTNLLDGLAESLLANTVGTDFAFTYAAGKLFLINEVSNANLGDSDNRSRTVDNYVPSGNKIFLDVDDLDGENSVVVNDIRPTHGLRRILCDRKNSSQNDLENIILVSAGINSDHSFDSRMPFVKEVVNSINNPLLASGANDHSGVGDNIKENNIENTPRIGNSNNNDEIIISDNASVAEITNNYGDERKK